MITYVLATLGAVLIFLCIPDAVQQIAETADAFKTARNSSNRSHAK